MCRKFLVVFALIVFIISREGRCQYDVEDEEDYEDNEEESKRSQTGVLDIIGGVFQGNLNKVISGAFSFSDKEIGEKLIPTITGQKPKPKPVKSEQTTDEEDN